MKNDAEIDPQAAQRAGLLSHAAAIAERDSERLTRRGEHFAAALAHRTARELEGWRRELEGEIGRHGRSRPRALSATEVRTGGEAA